MRVGGVVAALFISCVGALAEDTKPINFSGEWWNNRCGLATLVEQGSLLSGVYIPSSGLEAGRKLPLTGFRSGSDLISFVVNFGSNGPITAWVGQHTVERGTEEIITQWYMTIDVPDEKEDTDLYKSILAGADVFVRAKPSRCK
ncbi:MAG: avidin/streptavidin family protein [Pseudolabrys sp.]